jgi:hypothetical protein
MNMVMKGGRNPFYTGTPQFPDLYLYGQGPRLD